VTAAGLSMASREGYYGGKCHGGEEISRTDISVLLQGGKAAREKTLWRLITRAFQQEGAELVKLGSRGVGARELGPG